jgi:hypothetical protein
VISANDSHTSAPAPSASVRVASTTVGKWRKRGPRHGKCVHGSGTGCTKPRTQRAKGRGRRDSSVRVRQSYARCSCARFECRIMFVFFFCAEVRLSLSHHEPTATAATATASDRPDTPAAIASRPAPYRGSRWRIP